MPKLKAPIISLDARGKLGKLFSLAKRGGRNIIEKRPIPTDAKSPNQLFFRHMFTKCIDLWHLLSEAERQEWESSARTRHMTGYAWYISQCLRPNPGIYLPLQGGNMQGDIDMDTWGIEDLPDPTNPQDADTKAARDAAIALALEDCIDSHIHGWDGANWQKLEVESATRRHLKVVLARGDSLCDAGINSGGAIAASKYTLYGTNFLYGFDGAGWRSLRVESVTYPNLRAAIYQGGGIVHASLMNTDDQSTGFRGLASLCYLHGFDGSAWDRLRTYGTGVLKIGRAEIDSTTLRKTAAGAVVGGSRKLFWIACSPDSPSAEWELTDAVAGGGTIVYDHFDSDKHSEHLIFDPPMKFSNGIFIEKFDHMHSLVFCYI